MRALLLPVLVVAVACSSTHHDECQIAGTYSMTATPETMSAGCAALGGDPTTTTVTITARPPGKTGPDFAVELQGSQGGCSADLVDVCKIQSKCGLTLTDATDPANNQGTLQFSWTFDAKGFSGINSGALPPAKSLPGGCNFTSKATATRR